MAAVAVIARRGVERTRFVDVAAASGMSVGNLQHLFGRRSHLIREALEAASRADIEALEKLATAGDLPSALDSSLADARGGLGAGVLVRTELWHAALRDDELAALAAAAADAWRQTLEAESFVRTSSARSSSPASLPRPASCPR